LSRLALRTALVALRAVALLAPVIWAGPAWAGLADRVGATFALMAPEFLEAFQPLEGLVVAVESDTLYLDVTKVQVGQEFTVFRKGDVFRHPMTGKVLGRYEEVLGFAQVRRVQAAFTEALFIPLPGKPPSEPEDGVRITRGRIKVAVTPLLDLSGSGGDVRRVPFLMSTTLERSKRFQVADPLSVTDLFANGKVRVQEIIARPEKAMHHGKAIEVAGWVVPMLIRRGGMTYLDVTWISTVTGTALFSRRQPLTRPEPAEEQRFPWEPPLED
jgi:hypothetical protein